MINKGINKNSLKEINIKNNKEIGSEYNTEIHNNKIKFENLDDDIKIRNKLIYSDDHNINEKNRYTNNYFYHYGNNNNDIINEDYMYSTDGKVNIKYNSNINFGEKEQNISNNEKQQINNNINSNINNINSNKMNLYKNNSIINNDDPNMLFQSQAKSLLSEYVEDLDVIQYKEDSN